MRLTPLIRRAANDIVLAFGWRRAMIGFAAGAASALAMAPFSFSPILFLTLPVLVWMIDGAGVGRFGRLPAAAAAGWWFGFGYFLAGLYWVGIAFLVDVRTFGWLMPFAVIGLPAGLALFTALGAALAALLWSRGAARILALAAAMTIAEWLRGTVLSGFPWNSFGYALANPLPLAQSASLFGLWGMTFIALAVFASPAVLADDREATRRPWTVPAAALAILAVLMGFGALRLATTPTQFVDGPQLRIMQPNLPQDTKFNYGARHQVLDLYLALSRGTGPGGRELAEVTHLIWPESAFPFLLTREPEALTRIADLLPPGTVLITGAARAATAQGERLEAYNSIYALDHDATVLSVYDKVHLVPFGEYLPFQAFLERLGLMQLTKVRGGFTPGDRRRSFAVPGLPSAVPLICYEIIFPGAVLPRGERPAFLMNVTNDGWFGRSTGPYQHFQQARLRAIEEGLPLVRAANTGISAVIDPLGRIVGQVPLGQAGILDAALPQEIAPPISSQYGTLIPTFLVIVAILFCIRARRRQQLMRNITYARATGGW